MSELTITSCDGCGAIAHEDHVSMFPRGGWISVVGLRSGRGRYVDCCSLECLELVVQQLLGKAADTDMPRRRATVPLNASAVRELPASKPVRADQSTPKTPRKRTPKVA